MALLNLDFGYAKPSILSQSDGRNLIIVRSASHNTGTMISKLENEGILATSLFPHVVSRQDRCFVQGHRRIFLFEEYSRKSTALAISTKHPNPSKFSV